MFQEVRVMPRAHSDVGAHLHPRTRTHQYDADASGDLSFDEFKRWLDGRWARVRVNLARVVRLTFNALVVEMGEEHV